MQLDVHQAPHRRDEHGLLDGQGRDAAVRPERPRATRSRGSSDLLRSPTIKNAPLWPGYHASLERQVDPEYLERILLKHGDATIYAPTLETYRQQQKLRPYYDFMDVDTVRYTVGGEPRLFASVGARAAARRAAAVAGVVGAAVRASSRTAPASS